MIVLLKVILSLFLIFSILVAKFFLKDYKTTIKTQQFEEGSLISKIKLKFIFYFLLLTTISFMSLIVFYLISPLKII